MLRDEYPLDDILTVCGMPRSTFFYRLSQLRRGTPRDAVKERILAVYTRSKGLYGCRKIAYALAKGSDGLAPVRINFKTVNRMEREMGLETRYRKKKYVHVKGEESGKAPNIVSRDFRSDAPMRKLTTDVTEWYTPYGKIFLSSVIDMFNREVLAYDISQNNDSEMVMSMMQQLVKAHPESKGTSMMLHSDQGCLYRTQKYITFAERFGIVRSMSRRGNCYDNAMMESHFGQLKDYVGSLRDIRGVDDAVQRIEDGIAYHNNERIMLVLGGMSPVEYRENYEKLQKIG